MAVFIRQLFDRETCTYTYLLASKGQAVLIDPVLELVERDATLVKELGFNLVYVANTHVHADHVTGTGELKKIFPEAKSVLSTSAEGAMADVFVAEGDKLKFGDAALDVIHTPGHTAGCCSYLLPAAEHRPAKVYTGDALLIRGCGRTDFQQGSSETLFHSVTDKLFKLDPSTEVWPAHDYRGQTSSTIGEERKFNPRLKIGQDVPGFVDIMTNLKLAYPGRIDVSLPLNMRCGLHEVLERDQAAADSLAAKDPASTGE